MSYVNDLAHHYHEVQERLYGPIQPTRLVQPPRVVKPKQKWSAPKAIEIVREPWYSPKIYEAQGWIDIAHQDPLPRYCDLPMDADETARVRWAVRHLQKRTVCRTVDVIHVCSIAFGRSRLQLLSRRRCAPVVRPRQIAMAISVLMTQASLPQIARQFGNFDHTTVLHAFRRQKRLIEGVMRECQDGDAT